MSSAALKSGFLLAVNVFIVRQQEKKIILKMICVVTVIIVVWTW